MQSVRALHARFPSRGHLRLDPALAAEGPRLNRHSFWRPSWISLSTSLHTPALPASHASASSHASRCQGEAAPPSTTPAMSLLGLQWLLERASGFGPKARPGAT